MSSFLLAECTQARTRSLSRGAPAKNTLTSRSTSSSRPSTTWKPTDGKSPLQDTFSDNTINIKLSFSCSSQLLVYPNQRETKLYSKYNICICFNLKRNIQLTKYYFKKKIYLYFGRDKSCVSKY